MQSFIEHIIDTLGYAGLGLLMFGENIFPPIPSELIMPLAGYLTEQGRLSIPGVIIAGTTGSVLGALPFYALARWFGHDKLVTFVTRHGHWLALSSRDLERADRVFKRFGDWIILFGRLVPGVRSLISIPAGIYAMPVTRFLVLTLIGSTLWNILLFSGGYYLADQFDLLGHYIDPVSQALVGALLLAWLVRIGRHYSRRRTR